MEIKSHDNVKIDGVMAQKAAFDRHEHYKMDIGRTDEYGELPECPSSIKNVGWTLGNDCPYRCAHCYSMNARVKGKDMSIDMIDRIVEQLALNNIETVNLGGNEPLFTNGTNSRNTLLPYIINALHDAGMEVGITTSGISILRLYKDHRKEFDLINDIDVSLDSPYEKIHNNNRGAQIYSQAIDALQICNRSHKPHSVIMCAMSWNFDIKSIEELVYVAKSVGANVRINPIKPVLPEHMNVALSAEMYYAGFSRLLELCDPVDLGEPPIAALTNYQQARRCPCGRTSFRIHSITPTGEIYVSPCVYLHDYKSNLNILETDLASIIQSSQFRVFRQRNANPHLIDGCADCRFLSKCGGGCAARAYLHNLHETGQRSLLARDPYCPVSAKPAYSFPQRPELVDDQRLVHMDYLCTWIGRPRELGDDIHAY